MLAGLLRLAFLFIAAIAAAFDLLATRAWGFAAGALVFVLTLLILQTATPLLAYGLSGRRRPPEARGATVAQVFGAVLEEVLAFWRAYVVLQPFETFWRGEAPAPARDGRPILLIPGYCCNRAMWRSLERDLRARGRYARSVTLDPPFAGIDELADVLDAEIERFLATTGAEKAVLVGHSMGGLVARAYLARRGPGKVAALVTIATPHHGTSLARLAFGRNARELEPNSAFLQALNAHPPVIPTHSVWSARDEIIVPQDSARLPGARETVLTLPGHFGLLRAPQVLEIIFEEAGHK